MPGRRSRGSPASLGLALFYLALSRGTMGLVAPLTALLAAAIPAAVGLLGGDDAGLLDIAGMVAALVAVVLISLPDRRLGTPVLPTFHGSRVREWLLIVGASLCFAGFFLGVDASHDAGGEIVVAAVRRQGGRCRVRRRRGFLAWLLGRVLVHRVPRAALRTGTLAVPQTSRGTSSSSWPTIWAAIVRGRRPGLPVPHRHGPAGAVSSCLSAWARCAWQACPRHPGRHAHRPGAL